MCSWFPSSLSLSHIYTHIQGSPSEMRHIKLNLKIFDVGILKSCPRELHPSSQFKDLSYWQVFDKGILKTDGHLTRLRGQELSGVHGSLPPSLSLPYVYTHLGFALRNPSHLTQFIDFCCWHIKIRSPFRLPTGVTPSSQFKDFSY